MPALPPIRREVVVPANPDRAFAVFTENISAWWPMATHSVFGSGALVVFEDGRLVEATADGREAVWGEVSDWEPGRRLSFSWHPGSETASRVTVSFTATEDGTRVSLEHTGWEAYADPQTRREEYGHGWPPVLELYRAHVASEEGEPDPAERPGEPTETWVALMHTPGPSAPTDSPLVADPRFAEHVAFLQRMSTRGYLIAAGTLTDADGAGMTILRLPGPDRLSEVTELATVDDLAVAGGLFAVSVRPWNVLFHGLS